MASLIANQDIFNNLSAKFSQLLCRHTENERNLIEKLLNDLNLLDYRYTIVTNNTKAVLLVNQFSTLIPPDDILLVGKCCILISHLIIRQHVAIEGKTLIGCIQWLIQSTKHANTKTLPDILATLETLLRVNVDNIYEIHTNISLINELKGVLETEKQEEVIVLAVQCLEAVCGIPENYKQANCEQFLRLHSICAEIFIKFLLDEPIFDNLLRNKLLISCLRGLQNVIIQQETFRKQRLELLLGICRTYMVYQLKEIPFLKPERIMPSAMSIPEPTAGKIREKKGGKVTKQRKQRPSGSSKKDARKSENETDSASPNKTIFDIDQLSASMAFRLKTSDSDFSDTEASGKLHIYEGRLRQNTLNLLFNLCKLTDKQTIFAYWSSFLPEGPLYNSHSLMNCILKDPSARARMSALNVLLALLASSKTYLFQAENSERTTSFTPFSIILGSIIRELHQSLCLALNESSLPVLTQILKCIAALVQATPYHRLKTGLTSKLIRNIKQFIYHKDSTIQVAALITLGCLLASEPPLNETRDALLKTYKKKTKTNESEIISCSNEDFEFAEFSSADDDADDEDELETSVVDVEQMPWLLDKCLTNLEQANVAVTASVKLESLQLVSAMCQNYYDALIKPFIQPRIIRALEIGLSDKYFDVRFHAGRTVDFIAQAMIKEGGGSTTDGGNRGGQSLAFWTALLNHSVLLSLLQCEQYATLRAIGCDCLGSIGAYVYEQLPRDKQLLAITMLFTCSRDEDYTVRASAVRALAISVLYPSLKEDGGFIIDTAEAIHRNINDPNIGLRVKASWSLANLSDALVMNHNARLVMDELTADSINALIADAVKGCRDNDKVKANAVRALGNLLQILAAEIDNATMVDECVWMLIECATNGTNMKVRWNACYALGNVLKCTKLYESRTMWLGSLLDALCRLVVGFKNFKVRINAALALAQCPARSLFNAHFFHVWNSLLKALENSENMEDYSEYKHRDHLVEQICLSLGHLVTLLDRQDLSHLSDTFAENDLKMHIQKIYVRLLPERTTILIDAYNHLNSFTNLSIEHTNIIEMLKNVFNNNLNY